MSRCAEQTAAVFFPLAPPIEKRMKLKLPTRPRRAALRLAAACAASVASAAPPAAPARGVQFTDATAAAGIRFKHTSGAAGKKYLPETMGSGAAFFDADGDGRQDLFLVNSKSWTSTPGKRSLSALYRNNGDGTFADVTAASGLAVELYGQGAAAADYDNDGRVDLYVTALGGNKLFRNLGAGKFADVTARAGVGAGGFSSSAIWFDYDRDGKLDLYVTRYVQWTPEKDLFCTLDGRTKSYCTPESYPGQSPLLYRNKGDGTFEDATARAGLHNPKAKALGVAMLDENGDGWYDLIVANDTQPNNLYRNNKNGTFTDVATTAGVAFSEAGVARAGMGVDAGDYDLSGRPSIVIGNFSNEMMALYHNEGGGLFIDEAPTSAIGEASRLTLAFGCFFFDHDLDGWIDVFAANGHVADDIERVQPKVRYAQTPHLFRNVDGKRFEPVSSRLGPALQRPVVGRGTAYADYDADGDLDVVLTTNNGPAYLLRNDGGNRNHWLRVRTVGTRSNRDGIGARVTVTLPDGRKPWAVVKTGSSYLSQSELPLTFGLAQHAKATRVEVAWPGGGTEVLADVAANQAITVTEGKGITR
jgi:hypothetical protein